MAIVILITHASGQKSAQQDLRVPAGPSHTLGGSERLLPL